MKKLFYSFISALILLYSCKNETDYIKEENILDSLFKTYKNVESISYEERFVFAGTDDTATSFAYFEEAHDSTGYLLNYNRATYRFNKLFYQDVFNTSENINYYLNENAVISNNNNPAVNSEFSSISWSLLTQVKFLKQTLRDYPERIEIFDTTINNNSFYKINFSNPDGLPIKNRLMYLLKDTIYPTSFIVNKKNANIKYRTWGKMFFHISNIHFNPNQPDSIWSMTNLPEYFKLKLKTPVDIETKLLIPRGSKLPYRNFKTFENKDFKFENDSCFSIFVFFTRGCRACVKEIPKLNKLNKIDNLKVIGVSFNNDISKLKDYIKKYNIEYEVILNKDTELKKLFENGGFPVNYLINKDGKIIYSVLGNKPDFEEKIIKFIE